MDSRRIKTIGRAFALAAICLMAAIALGDDRSTDGRFLDGLRERQLFESADLYCRERLADATLSDRARAELTIELARTLAEHAAAAPPERQPELWQQAEATLDEWLARHDGSAWRPLAALQRALIPLARGELARQQAQVAGQPEAWLVEAREHLRDAIGRLEPLIVEIDRLLVAAQAAAGRRSPGDATETFSADELISLGRNVRFQLARARMAQGESYEPRGTDRAHALNQAVRQLDELVGLPDDDPLVWRSRLSRATCQRLLGDHGGAEESLARIAEHAPADVVLRARTEALRLALDRKQVGQAVGLLQTPAELAHVAQPDWDFARLEASLAAWSEAVDRGDATAAEQWQARATEMVRFIESRWGAYWTRRAETLLASRFRHAADSGDLDTLVRAARSAYLGGQLDEALAAYDKAAQLAAEAGDAAVSLDAGYLAAMIVQKQGDHRAAAERCRRLALAATAEPRAAEIHLQAVRNMAELAKSRDDDALGSYTALLDEHLQTWPRAATADQVRWWLGALRRYERDWDRAIVAYRDISPGDVRFAEAVDAVGQCHEARLAEVAGDCDAVGRRAGEAAGWFESLVLGPDGRLPERISPAQRSAAIWAARMRFRTADGYEAAGRLLTAVLNAAADAPDDWRREAEALLVVALAGGGHVAEAGQWFDRLAAAGPGPLFDVLEQLRVIEQSASGEQAARLADLQLRAVELLGRRQSELSVDQRFALRRVSAGAAATAGRTADALGQYAELVQLRPDDGELGEAYAGLLAAQNDRAALDSALAQWREIERRSKSGTARWFRAKYAVAELNLRLGRPDKAEQILRLVALLHPEMGGPTMKPRFEQLLRQCGSGGK
ncbi:MAG TPA: hypothetical protein DD670_05240 [Planctomycetaceae bacterium]|nr:hypothetical protein [Planctomycetaceae bacterium]